MMTVNWIRFVPVAVLTAALFSASAGTWQKTTAPTDFWESVAVSADGTRIVAAGISGRVYISTNFGASWIQSAVPLAGWTSVASSADGSRLVVAGNDFFNVNNPGCVYSSSNFGNSWISNSLPRTNWGAVASSADGLKLIACPWGGQAPSYSSTNGGSTWITNSSAFSDCKSVACSSEGTKIVAVTSGNGIYSSANMGTNWTVRSALRQEWFSVAASADGSKFYTASIWGDPNDGEIYASTNSGTNWALLAGAPATNWTSIASSSDGIRLVAAAGGYSGGYIGPICVSADSGATWTMTDAPITNWTSVACSADGTRLVAASAYSGIYVARLVPPLTISLPSTNAVLSWTASSNGFALQYSADLNTTNWRAVTNTRRAFNPFTLQNQVETSVSKSNGFYRLSSP